MLVERSPPYASQYSPKDWDVKMKKARTVLSYRPTRPGPARLMLGIQAFGASRAFPYETVLREKLVKDHVGSRANHPGSRP